MQGTPLADAGGRGVLANVAPSGRNPMLLSYPGLRRPPGASPGVMHGTALRAELGQSGIYPREAAEALKARNMPACVVGAFQRREAAEALKARNIPAQGKHAESVRRPG